MSSVHRFPSRYAPISIALIKTEATIKKILTAMGLPAEPPPVRPARAPPSPA